MADDVAVVDNVSTKRSAESDENPNKKIKNAIQKEKLGDEILVSGRSINIPFTGEKMEVTQGEKTLKEITKNTENAIEVLNIDSGKPEIQNESNEVTKNKKDDSEINSVKGSTEMDQNEEASTNIETNDEIKTLKKTTKNKIEPQELDPGEGTSKSDGKSAKEDFTKPGQVRRRPRRISVRQKTKNSRGKFIRKRPLNNFKRRKGVIVPPTKFLLGGNINDPLNLNSLQDEEMNRAMNAVTPKSSPLPTPKHRRGEVEVLMPRNMKDPLHLTSANDDAEYLKQLLSKKKRKRKRKRGNSGSGSGKEESFEAVVPMPQEEPSSTVEGAFVPPDTQPAAKRDALTLTIKEAPKRRKDGLDKIVSPVVPQPGAWKRGLPKPGAEAKKRRLAKTPKFNPRAARFQYGNYDRYYGYRNPNRDADPRLVNLQQHAAMFLDKDVLDIGCNIGHVTLCVARDFGARTAVGLDIDKKLIGIARKNIKHYVTVAATPAYCPSTRMPTPHTPYSPSSPFPHHYVPNSPAYHQQNSPAHRQSPYPYSPASRSPFTHHYVPNSPAYEQSPCAHQVSPSSRSPFGNASSPVTPTPRSPATESSQSAPHPAHPPSFFPISMPIIYGPLEVPGGGTPEGPVITVKPFPHNVSFVQGSYVLESDALLASETAQFDVILCLSVTKWIHLNWGDVGIKRAFRRMFAQLRPGGKLVLEPQGWPSYKRKKTLTEQIYKNYLEIELMPEKFIEYLLSSAVGFSTVEEIGAPAHPSKGFRRCIHVLTKPGQTPSSCNTPLTYTPYSQRTCVRNPVYTSLGGAAYEEEEKKKD